MLALSTQGIPGTGLRAQVAAGGGGAKLLVEARHRLVADGGQGEQRAAAHPLVPGYEMRLHLLRLAPLVGPCPGHGGRQQGLCLPGRLGPGWHPGAQRSQGYHLHAEGVQACLPGPGL
jgi:hypothetical protein